MQRKGHKLVASETGTHESINNRDPEAGNRKVFNTLVSEAGWPFVQKMQWENVTDHIVGKSNPETASWKVGGGEAGLCLTVSRNLF